MTSALGRSPLLPDSDVDELACQFVNSAYADNNLYSDWPLERRLEGFLRRRGLARLAEDGDAYDLIFNRVMAYIGAAPRPAVTTDVRADKRPAKQGLPSLSRTESDWSDGHSQYGDFEI